MAIDTLVKRFEKQCASTPESVACQFEREQLSYQAVNERANQLAQYLKTLGVNKSDIVGLCIDRGIELPVALLAILKLGAVYLPIDPSYPKERIAYMLNNAKVRYVITQTLHTVELPNTLNFILLDDFEKPWREQSKDNLNVEIHAADPAYVIYTSGSTGQPKGIVQTHQTIANLISWQASQFSERKPINILQFAALGFDVSLQEIFFTLLNGHILIISPQKLREDLNLLPQFVNDHNINLLFLPTSVLEYFCHESINQHTPLKALERIIVAGEALYITRSIKDFFAQNPSIQLENQYGPSETHVVSSYVLPENSENWPTHPPIGKAIDNTQLFVLDDKLNPTDKGELFIAGAGLAKYYLPPPEQNKEKFIDFKLDGKTIHAYRSGDIVKKLKDGNLHYVERIDSQVKIRGYRIEPSEIEENLLKHPAIRQCAIIVSHAGKRKYLTAYIKPHEQNNNIDLTEIKTFLKNKLPDYMIPSAFIALPELPMTSNMKIDKNKLANEFTEKPAREKIATPENEIESNVVSIFSKILKTNKNNISTLDDTYTLGIDSITAMQIISRIKEKYSVNLSVKNLLASKNIKTFCKEITLLLEKPKNKNSFHVTPNPSKTTSPSAAQKSLWFLQKLDPNNPFYNEATIIELTGQLNKNALKKSLEFIIDRHEALNTSFFEENGELKQLVKKRQINEAIIEKTIKSHEQSTVEKTISAITETPFQINGNFLYQFYLININEKKHILIMMFHHIIVDGWSIDILLKELSMAYKSFIKNKPYNLPPLKYQPSNYIDYQNKNQAAECLSKEINYWKKNLKETQSIKITTSENVKPFSVHEGENLYFKLSKNLTKKLFELTKQEKTTLFNILLSCTAVLLFKYSNQNNFAIGTAHSTRKFKPLEKMIGYFSNTLALKNSLSSNMNFSSLLKTNEKTLLGAQENSNTPFNEVIKHLFGEREAIENPLFQVLVGLEPFKKFKPAITEKTKIIKLKRKKVKFDLSLLFEIVEKRLVINFEYASKIFNKKLAKNFIAHLEKILETVCLYPKTKIAKINLLSAKEEKTVISLFNKTKSPVQWNKAIPNIIRDHAKTRPNQIAVIFDDKKITYLELEQKSNQLACYIKNFGEPRSDFIAICLPRSIDMIIAILAVLKTEAAYCPIDPHLPAERIEYMLDNSNAKLLITHSTIPKKIRLKQTKEIFIDKIQEDTANLPADEYKTKNNEKSLAYVIYTSGSTGLPKGVVVKQSSILNLVSCLSKKIAIESTLSITTISFDIAQFDILATLMLGKKLVIAPLCAIEDPYALHKLIKKHKINFCQTTPSNWKNILNAEPLTSKLTIITTGEATNTEVARQLLATKNPIWNAYGPTETTIWSTIAKLNPHNINPPTIGKPIDNTAIYILDNTMQATPINIAGELYIAGDGLAAGYLNKEDMTKEKFLKNPLKNTPYPLLYKTGDLAYWNTKGELIFLGRNDNQIKLRGFRIETSEIDCQINKIEGVQDTYTTITNNANPSLISYVERAKITNTQNSNNETIENQLLSWQMVWQHVYKSENEELNKFDISGWISSFTNKPLSVEEMKEWVNCSINRILALKPQNILEIGCGTGLMLEGLISHCRFYLGTDISEEVIKKLAKKYVGKSNAKFEPLQAHQIKPDTIKNFDTIVINSVIQYFPNGDYLTRVLTLLIKNMPINGRIYIGDIRNFDLLELFHCAVLLENNKNIENYDELLSKVKLRTKFEKELNVSPRYFYLQAKNSERKLAIEIQLRQGNYLTEMNLFRYDVILYLDEDSTNKTDSCLYNSTMKSFSPKKILKKLPCYITNIPNKRFFHIAEKLEQRYKIKNELNHPIDPEVIYQTCHSLGLFVELSFSSESPLYFNAKISSSIALRKNKVLTKSNLYNNPLRIQRDKELKLKILQKLKTALPTYMIPSHIVFLESFPRTINGKLDKRAFPKLEDYVATSGQLLPNTEIEKKLLKIWQKILGLAQISKESNFFEIGGHSLLTVQLMSEINDEFKTNLPIKTIFETQSIETMAKLIEKITKSKNA